MKTLISRILASLLIVMAVMLPVCASAYAEPAENYYLLDYADVLTDSEEQSFLSSASTFYSSTGWYAAFVTTNDTQSKSSMVYADDTYDELFGINTDGILFLIDFDTRNFYISTSGEAISAIDDYEVERILDAAAPYMSSKDYQGAAEAVLSKCEGLCYDYRNGTDTYHSSSSGSISINLTAILVAFVLAAVAFILVVVGVLNAYKNKTAPTADVYAKGADGFVLHQSTDTFIREYTTSVKIETSSGGGSSGGSSHSSSGGGSHGGGGRSF